MKNWDCRRSTRSGG